MLRLETRAVALSVLLWASLGISCHCPARPVYFLRVAIVWIGRTFWIWSAFSSQQREKPRRKGRLVLCNAARITLLQADNGARTQQSRPGRATRSESFVLHLPGLADGSGAH